MRFNGYFMGGLTCCLLDTCFDNVVSKTFFLFFNYFNFFLVVVISKKKGGICQVIQVIFVCLWIYNSHCW